MEKKEQGNKNRQNAGAKNAIELAILNGIEAFNREQANKNVNRAGKSAAQPVAKTGKPQQKNNAPLLRERGQNLPRLNLRPFPNKTCKSIKTPLRRNFPVTRRIKRIENRDKRAKKRTGKAV